MLLSPLSAVLLDESLFFFFCNVMSMLGNCKHDTVFATMCCNQCFVTMFLYIISNHILVTGYVLLDFGEIACNK